MGFAVCRHLAGFQDQGFDEPKIQVTTNNQTAEQANQSHPPAQIESKAGSGISPSVLAGSVR